MPSKKRFILVFILVCIAFALPSSAECFSFNPREDVEIDATIDYANYLDLDADDRADDVLTICTVLASTGGEDISFTLIGAAVTLPSGRMYHHLVQVEGGYNTITVSIYWFNIATESGWYRFDVLAFAFTGSSFDYAYATVDFDPPEGGDPGPPLTEKAIIISNVTGT